MTHEAFVYVWTNIENNKFYIGKHKGTDDDGYISSGKYFLTVYNAAPHLFVRDIIFRGTEAEAHREETIRIRTAIREVGYKGIYNLTSWWHLSQWRRTCLHCGAVCCPENEDWAIAFEEVHFNNCSGRISQLPKASVQTIARPIIKKPLSGGRPEKKEYPKEWDMLSKEERKRKIRKAERIKWWKDNRHLF